MNHLGPGNEPERIKALKQYAILDTFPEQDYDDFTFLVSLICDVPIALITLVDESRQWFKSKTGLNVNETPREVAFCAHTILNDRAMIIDDATQDERFSENPLVTGSPNIRFYAGVPLITPGGFGIGTLCAIDSKPRQITDVQEQALKVLAGQVMVHLEQRRVSRMLAEALEKIKVMEGLIPICSYCKNIRRDTGFWTTLEEYLTDHSVADLTHGICPKCMKKELLSQGFLEEANEIKLD